jgi:exodeoxyribonuclease-3
MKKRNIGWRLDYIYASGKLAQAATSCVVEKETGTSDHGPVVATFDDKRAGIKQHAVAAGTAAAKRTEQLEQPGLGI